LLLFPWTLGPALPPCHSGPRVMDCRRCERLEVRTAGG
jgi:hypothetical protein